MLHKWLHLVFSIHFQLLYIFVDLIKMCYFMNITRWKINKLINKTTFYLKICHAYDPWWWYITFHLWIGLSCMRKHINFPIVLSRACLTHFHYLNHNLFSSVWEQVRKISLCKLLLKYFSVNYNSNVFL